MQTWQFDFFLSNSSVLYFFVLLVALTETSTSLLDSSG